MSYLKESKAIPEGTWFAVPLDDERYVTGLVARRDPHNSKPVIVGYFFGPSRTTALTIEEVRSLSPSKSILIARLGYLGLVQGKWPIIGHNDGWDRAEWPATVFCERPTFGPPRKVTYDDHDPTKIASIESITSEACRHLSEGGLYGAEAVEIKLRKLLLDAGE